MDVSAQAIISANTLKYKLRVKLAISPSHYILTPGRPVPALTPKRQRPGRVATGAHDSTRKNPLSKKRRPNPGQPLSRKKSYHYDNEAVSKSNDDAHDDVLPFSY